jgi:ABC-type transport system involved in cytochrome c biogenesis permease component
MFERTKRLTATIWKWFRSYPLFVQLLLVVPILSAMALTLLVGNMGLALMGTAIAINSVVVGWIGGVLVLVLGKAGIIVAKDRNKKG